MNEFKRVDAKRGRTTELKEMPGKYSRKKKRNRKYDRAVEVQCIE